jgi:hypothetical protein
MAFAIGYGRGEIEPAIAPLVQAAQGSGFVTFSSCEGHADAEGDFSISMRRLLR